MDTDEKIKVLSQNVEDLKKERSNIFAMPIVTETDE